MVPSPESESEILKLRHVKVDAGEGCPLRCHYNMGHHSNDERQALLHWTYDVSPTVINVRTHI